MVLKRNRHIALTLCLLLFMSQASAVAQSEVIERLTKKISEAGSDMEKSTLYVYRARNYKIEGEYAKARDDYDNALVYNHRGWIHLERGRFFLAVKNYEQAIREAVAAEKETPTLKKESQLIISRASKAYKKQLNRENPPEILLTTVWRTQPKKTGKRSSAKVVGAGTAKGSKTAPAPSRTRRVSRS